MIYSRNKKAQFDFIVLDEFEAGMKLSGAQVKSIRAGNIQLKGSYVQIKAGVVSLTAAHISKPEHITEYESFDVNQDILLLLHKKQILKLQNAITTKGNTLIALEVYQPNNSNKIKIKIGLAQGKKEHDKRASLKEKDDKIRTARDLKEY